MITWIAKITRITKIKKKKKTRIKTILGNLIYCMRTTSVSLWGSGNFHIRRITM